MKRLLLAFATVLAVVIFTVPAQSVSVAQAAPVVTSKVDKPATYLRVHTSLKQHDDTLRTALSKALRMAPNKAPKLLVVVGTDNTWLTEQVKRHSKELNENEAQNFLKEAQNRGLNTDWAYSLRGPDVQLILINPLRTEERHVTQAVLREVVESLVGWNGGYTQGYPCWAAEGLGKPVAFAVYAEMFGGNADGLLRQWVANTPVRASVDSYTAAEAFTSDCKDRTVGHAHGAWLSARLMKDHGVKGVIAWVDATKGARDWRAVFKDHFGLSVTKAYQRASQTWPTR